jgi:alpha-galactosidase/6-phospho-beta-glucosidase family protein
MKRVKEFERLTIQAATEGSYECALRALTVHPLVADTDLARLILEDYIFQHGALFPKLR